MFLPPPPPPPNRALRGWMRTVRSSWDEDRNWIRESWIRESSTRKQSFFLSLIIAFPILCFSSRISELQEMAGNDSLVEFLVYAVEAAWEAGEIIRKGFSQTKNLEHKGQEMMGKKVKRTHAFKNPVDLVTETGKACEGLIFNHLRKRYPTHKFIGKETTAALGATELTDEHTWIVNPLDGTINFEHGLPFVCVSIGLTIQKVPTVGVVYKPILHELFTAIHGRGAFLNGNPIEVSSRTELIRSLLAAEVGTNRDKETIDVFGNMINALLLKARSLLMVGSRAIDLCGVACGRLDASFEIGFGGPWDMAGAAVIVREAGGEVFDPSGKDFDLTSQRVAASNPFLKDAFVEILRQTGC